MNIDLTLVMNNGIDEKAALSLLTCSEKDYYSQVMPIAREVRQRTFGNKISFCSIVNAKSGACIEDCKFCTQSIHHQEASSPLFGLKSVDEITQEAIQAKKNGATEFSIVTSGRTLHKEKEIHAIIQAIHQIHSQTQLETCASLGLMSKQDLKRLKEAGMTHFHHNIETARSYFPNIVTSHTFDEEVESIQNAKELGFKVCCGGILGMGESLEQRVEFAFNLKEIDPDSIPLNFLNARPGTPLEGLHELTPLDCLKIISMVRLVMPQKNVMVCGGREVNLKEYQDQMFDAGANGTMLGNYLTTQGQAPESDLKMIERLGLIRDR